MPLKIENPQKKILAHIVNLALFPFFSILRIFFQEYFTKKLPSEFKKILIIRADHIGDVIMATSVFRNIKRVYPDCKISVLVGRWGKEILEGNQYVDEIIVHNCPWWEKVRGEKTSYAKWALISYPRALKQIRNGKFDAGIDLRGDFRHILFFLFLGNVKFRISYNRSGGEYLLNKAVPYKINMHEIEKNYRLLEEIGIRDVPFEEKKPEIYLSEKDEKRVREIFYKNNIEKHTLKIVIHPSAGNRLRMWKEEKFSSFIKCISGKYKSIFFLMGSERDKNICEKIKKLTDGNVLNLAGKLTVKETASLIKKSDIFVGNDSAIGHIASCFNIPSIILFGPTTPERCKPYNKNLYSVYNKFPCSPCLQKKCIITHSVEISKCMESIKVEEVVKLFEEVMRKLKKSVIL